jgi:hypothetical protein
MKAFSIVLISLGGALLLAVAITRAVLAERFDLFCGTYIYRAAIATDQAMAIQSLDVAIAYTDQHGMTAGYTSVLYRDATEDVGFWHELLTSARDQVKALPTNATPLERTNVLMKLHENLVAPSGAIHVPDGISGFPYNSAFTFLGWFGVAMIIGGLIIIIVEVVNQ